jgi:hypothetical protein
VRCAPRCSAAASDVSRRARRVRLDGKRRADARTAAQKLPQFLAAKRRPIDRAFVYSIFERDHPETAEKRVVDAFADAILALDDSMLTGTYIDMCSRLPSWTRH